MLMLIEQLSLLLLDKETMHKKDQIMSRYAELIYNGYWYSKERFKITKD